MHMKDGVRAVLVEQLFFPIFPLCFSEKNRKSRKKQETFPKFGKLTECKIFGRLRIPISGRKKSETAEILKIARKKYLEISTKKVLR